MRALMFYSPGGNVLVTSMQTRTTQRPARLRPPNHTTERRQQQPGSLRMNAQPAMQPCHAPVHSPEATACSFRQARCSLPATLPRRGPRRRAQHCPEAREQSQERGQAANAACWSKHGGHQASPPPVPPLSDTSVAPVVCFTSKVFLLWARGATAACAGLRWHELTADRKAASLPEPSAASAGRPGSTAANYLLPLQLPSASLPHHLCAIG